MYDVLYLIFVFTLIVKHYINVTGIRWYNYYKYHFGIPVTNTCSNTAVWLTLTFTIERYIGVCHPMKGKALCTPQRAKYIILVVCTAAAVLTVPDFFAKRVETVVVVSPSGENVTTYVGRATELSKMASFSVGYSYMIQVLFTFMPLILLLAFNSLLIRAVMQANRQRHAMANMNVVRSERQERHSRDQHRITVMLITVVIVFLLCQSPQAIQNILLSYYSHKGLITPVKIRLFTITANVFNLFVIINASVNFILYSAFSTKFRRTFSRLFCRCLQRQRPSDVLFSEMATAVTSAPLNGHHTVDDSRVHLLHAARNRSQVTYNWAPRSGGPSVNRGSATNNMAPNSLASGYSARQRPGDYTSARQNGQSIVSSL
ncbi:MAG: G-protein coupled receptor [Gammaproteobacteria bacterium]|nr:G-protein coupled receptor [Gammaproteobacteria bacterium]